MGNKTTTTPLKEPFLFDASTLPEDIWICVFEFINTTQIAQTCKQFYHLSKVAKHCFVFQQDPSIPPLEVIHHLSFHPKLSNYNLNGKIWKTVALEKLKLTDEHLQVLLEQCPNIESLTLKYNTLLTEHSWTIIRNFARKLKHLSIGNHLTALKNLLEEQTGENTQLESLELNGRHVMRDSVVSIPSSVLVRFRKLKHLTIPAIQLEQDTCSTTLESITFSHETGFAQQSVHFSTVFPRVHHLGIKIDVQLFFMHSMSTYWQQFEELPLTSIDMQQFCSATEDLQFIGNQMRKNAFTRLVLPPQTSMMNFDVSNMHQLQEFRGPKRYLSDFDTNWITNFVKHTINLSRLHIALENYASLKEVCIHLGHQLKSLQLYVSGVQCEGEQLGSYFTKLESLYLLWPSTSLQQDLIGSLSQNVAIQGSLKQLCLDSVASLLVPTIVTAVPKFHQLDFLNLFKVKISSKPEDVLLSKCCVNWRKRFTVWFVKDHNM